MSIRARLLVLALSAIAPLVFDRVHGLELARGHRVDRARAEVIDLARRGTESQRQIIYSVRSLLQIVASPPMPRCRLTRQTPINT